MGGKLGLSVILHEDSCEFVVVEVLVLQSALKIFNSSWQTQFWMPVNFFLQNLCMSSIFNVECQELIEKLITVL